MNAASAQQHCSAWDRLKSFHDHWKIQNTNHGYYNKLLKSNFATIKSRSALVKQNGYINRKLLLPIMTKNKEGPEHCSLSSPIERPNYPVVEISCSSSQTKNHNDIPHYITHGFPRVLHPTVFRNGSSYICQIEGWWCTRVKFRYFLSNPINAIHTFFFSLAGGNPHRCTHSQFPPSLPIVATWKSSWLELQICHSLICAKKSKLWRLLAQNGPCWPWKYRRKRP